MLYTGSIGEWVSACWYTDGGGDYGRCSDSKHREICQHHQRATREGTRSAETTGWV